MCPIIFETTYIFLSPYLFEILSFLFVCVCVCACSFCLSLCVSDSSSRLSERWSLIHADWFWLCLQSPLDCFYVHCTIFSFVRRQRSVFRLCPFLLLIFPFSLVFYVCHWLNVVRHFSNRLSFCCFLYTWMGEANAFNFCMSRSERFNYVCCLFFFVVRLIEDAQ
ncbi:hypothetical protein BDV24DRAFT_39918 [Aspergillus arachidicola]|uniref:Uncharacterized protein n=1 Tax=Aspergillus arachidicola TaxID=656916 RepID=A0A5N6YBU6_9EURO|nr:hypothetical protein BDV24DRAFT_39918 [Aspergillus arachidicola]